MINRALFTPWRAMMATTAACALLAAVATAQPIAKEGTELVPNEYGGAFPREIIWEADGAEMVLVPYGTFTRGLSEARGGGEAERPERIIYLPSFYIDKHEVTNEMYARFTAQVPAERPRPAGNPGLREPAHPVVAIPWDSAVGYAEWAGKRLPTEAMWEKAARGPQNTLYTTGDTPPSPEVVIHGRGGAGVTVPAQQNTGDVSGYGALHMNGNVSEWVWDWYAREYYAEEIRDNPSGPPSGMTKVYRGGSFLTRPEDLRLTLRMAGSRNAIRDEVGFRTVWVPADPRTITQATPTPSPVPTIAPRDARAQTVAAMATAITPFLERRDPQLPKDMMATRAHASKGSAAIQLINFTPYDLSVTFVGPEVQRVFRYAEPLGRMSFRNVTLPREVDLHMLAYAYGAPRNGPVDIGFLRSESNAIVVIPTETFGQVRDLNAGVIPVLENPTASQFYGEFQPRWNVLEVNNTLDDSLVLKVEDTIRGLDKPETVGEYTVEPLETLRLTLMGGRFRFTVDYFGANEPSSTPTDLRIDDRAARRLLVIKEDAKREGGVMVITERRPYLALELFEARRIPPPGK
jgi:iron(II)-dependent oxidoreductase